LNHDVFKLSKFALKLTVKGIGKLYKDEVGSEFKDAIDEQIKNFKKKQS
jgi:hypothetical protein